MHIHGNPLNCHHHTYLPCGLSNWSVVITTTQSMCHFNIIETHCYVLIPRTVWVSLMYWKESKHMYVCIYVSTRISATDSSTFLSNPSRRVQNPPWDYKPGIVPSLKRTCVFPQSCGVGSTTPIVSTESAHPHISTSVWRSLFLYIQYVCMYASQCTLLIKLHF